MIYRHLSQLHVLSVKPLLLRPLHVRKSSLNSCLPASGCHTTVVDHALQSQLLMPPNSSAKVAAAVSVSSECEATMVVENIQLISALFPRSSMRSIEKLLLKNPRVLMAPLPSWNEFLAAYGVSQQAFCGIVMWEAAHILTDSTPFQAGTVILTLQQWGLSSSNINRSVLLRAPQVLLLELQQLHAIHCFLQGQCGLPGSRIRDVVVAMPQLLLQDVKHQLQPRVDLLQQELGADPHQLASCLCRQPGLLMADHTSRIQPRLQQLRSFGFVGQELLQLVCADPVVLTLSTSSLQRKWQYLTEQMGAGKQQVLQQCPTYFSKALVSEIAPRHSYVVARGMQGRFSCQAQGQGQGQQDQQAIETDQQQAASGMLAQLPRGESLQQKQQQQTGELQQLQPPCAQSLGFGDQQPGFRQQLHLGKLLNPSIPEFLQTLGQADAAEYQEYVQHWAQTEGLKWTAVRVT